MELFGSDDLGEVFRNEAVLEFEGPAVEGAEAERFHDALLESVAGQGIYFIRMEVEGLEVFPDRPRCLAEHGIPFFTGEVFKDVDFRAISPVFFKIICIFAGLLGQFSQEGFAVLTAGESIFDAVEGGQISHGDGDVGIGEGVRRTEFEPCSRRACDVADEADEDRTVTGLDVRTITAEGRYDANRGFKTRFQAVQGVCRCRNEGVHDFVVFEHAHDGAVTDDGQEVALHIRRVEEVDEFAVLHDGPDAEVRMFTGTGNAVNRFCLEGDFKAVFTEYFTDDDTGCDFIICSLDRVVGKFPVDFELFEDEGQFTGIVDLGFDAADFLMAHFRFETVFFEAFDGLFKSRTNDAVRALPILFLQFLRSRQEARRYILARRLDPEFQFRRRREDDFFDVVDIDRRTGQAILFDQRQDLVADVVAGVAEDRPGVDVARGMTKEAGNTQSPYGFSRFRVDIVVVVVDEPADRRVGFDVDAGIGQDGDARQDDGRTIGLECRRIEEFIVVIKEDADRNLFVRIIACQIDAYEGYEFDFRMLFQ